MTHLIVCREYAPAPYPPGGIGTYVRHMARLLAEAGETVHVIAQRWEGAAEETTKSCGGKLIVHRVSLQDPVSGGSANISGDAYIIDGLANSDCPSQLFAWQAARRVESLVQTEPIDLIEAQEWEAPLYYLQLRRALGLGPRQQPPCLVHLHSPSRLIFQYNKWDTTLTDFVPLSRIEEYTIRAADALVCPSHYLAVQAERLFALAAGDIQVIPYPLGETAAINRANNVWACDTICYFGRLELRKGVVEWVDAAVQVALAHPTVTFEFIGSDTSLTGGAGESVKKHIQARIPNPLRGRFRFQDSMPHSRLYYSLSGVAASVVPSQWDNLPFSCIEAMATGLPVLASPNGGMAELVTDGESGWIAPDATASGLASTLRRVLDTPPLKRAEMGAEAGRSVRRICANDSVLRRHLELRARVAGEGSRRSRSVPAPASVKFRPAQEARPPTGSNGVGVVVTCLDNPELLQDCLASIGRSTRPVAMVAVVVVANNHHLSVREIATRAESANCIVIYTSGGSRLTARTAGAEALRAAAPDLESVVFLSEEVRLNPEYLGTCQSIFTRQPAVGLIASWVGHPTRMSTDSPASTDACCALRMPAYLAVEQTRNEDAIPAEGELSSAVEGCGFAAVTYPQCLVSVSPSSAGKHERNNQARRYSVMALAQRGSARLSLTWFLAAPLREKARWIRSAIRKPGRAALWIGWQLRRAAGNMLASR